MIRFNGMLRAPHGRSTTRTRRSLLRKALDSFAIFCIAAQALACAGLIWGSVFMFKQPDRVGEILGSAYIANEDAAFSFILLLLIQSTLSLWYLLCFLKSDRLSLIGMFAIAMPLLLFTSYVSPPPLNVLSFFSLQFAIVTAIFCWFENYQIEHAKKKAQEESL